MMNRQVIQLNSSAFWCDFSTNMAHLPFSLSDMWLSASASAQPQAPCELTRCHVCSNIWATSLPQNIRHAVIEQYMPKAAHIRPRCALVHTQDREATSCGWNQLVWSRWDFYLLCALAWIVIVFMLWECSLWWSVSFSIVEAAAWWISPFFFTQNISQIYPVIIGSEQRGVKRCEVLLQCMKYMYFLHDATLQIQFWHIFRDLTVIPSNHIKSSSGISFGKN